MRPPCWKTGPKWKIFGECGFLLKENESQSFAGIKSWNCKEKDPQITFIAMKVQSTFLFFLMFLSPSSKPLKRKAGSLSSVQYVVWL